MLSYGNCVIQIPQYLPTQIISVKFCFVTLVIFGCQITCVYKTLVMCAPSYTHMILVDFAAYIQKYFKITHTSTISIQSHKLNLFVGCSSRYTSLRVLHNCMFCTTVTKHFPHIQTQLIIMEVCY